MSSQLAHRYVAEKAVAIHIAWDHRNRPKIHVHLTPARSFQIAEQVCCILSQYMINYESATWSRIHLNRPVFIEERRAKHKIRTLSERAMFN